MPDNQEPGAPAGDELSEDELSAVAGGNLLDDAAALIEAARKKLAETFKPVMDMANGGPSQ